MPTVAQLKAQLAAKGLPTDGVKAVLEARLAAAVPAAAAPAQVDVAQLASLKRQLDQLMAAQQGAGGAAGGNAGGDGPALLDLDELKQTNDLEKLKQLCRERGLKDKGNRMQLRAWLRAWNDKQDTDDGDDDVEDELEAGPTKKQATGGQKGDVKVGDLAKRDDKVYRVQALVQGPELIYQLRSSAGEEIYCSRKDFQTLKDVKGAAPPAPQAGAQLFGALGLGGQQHVPLGAHGVPGAHTGHGLSLLNHGCHGGACGFSPPPAAPGGFSPAGGAAAAAAKTGDYTAEWQAAMGGASAASVHAQGLHHKPLSETLGQAQTAHTPMPGAYAPTYTVAPGCCPLLRHWATKSDSAAEPTVTMLSTAMGDLPVSRRSTEAPPLKNWAAYHVARGRHDMAKTLSGSWRDKGEHARSEEFAMALMRYGETYKFEVCMAYDEECRRRIFRKAPGMADFADYDGRLWAEFFLLGDTQLRSPHADGASADSGGGDDGGGAGKKKKTAAQKKQAADRKKRRELIAEMRGKAKVTTKNGAGVCYAWNVNKPGCTCERGGACNFSHVCCLCGSDQHRACDCDAVTSS